MFPRSYFAGRYFAPRYWPQSGDVAETVVVSITDVLLRHEHQYMYGTDVEMYGVYKDETGDVFDPPRCGAWCANRTGRKRPIPTGPTSNS